MADGSVNVKADHSDVAGNNATQASINVTKNTTQPTVSITFSYINNANKTNATISGSCSENGRAVTIGGAVSASATCNAGAWSTSANFSALPEGDVNVTADHSDASSNPANQATQTLIKDTVAPTVAVNPALVYVNAANDESYGFNGTCSEAGRTVFITGAATGSASCTAGNWSTNLDLSASADGSVALTVTLTDEAGNSSSVNHTLTKDTVLPSIAFNVLGYVNASNMSAYTVAGTCSEDGRTITLSGDISSTTTCSSGTWSKSIDLSGKADGNIAVTASISDVAGNIKTANTTLIKNTDPVTVTLNAPAAINLANKTAYPLSGSCSENSRNVSIGGAVTTTATCSSGTWSKSIDYSAVADGSVALTIDHQSAAGNSATQISTNLTKDTVIPTVAIDAFTIHNANKTAVTVSGTCSEDTHTVSISGGKTGAATCSSGTWSTSIDYSSVSDGSVSVKADLTDAAGNAAVQASISVTKDTGIPTVSISSTNINAANQSAVTISGNCSENTRSVTIGGAISTTATCSGGTWSKSVDFSGVADGAVNLTADHSDAAGNSAVQATQSLTKDTVAPSVAVTSAPSYVNIANQSSVPVSGTCSEDGRTVSISGATTGSGTCSSGTWSANLNMSALADAVHTINITHTDAAGNSTTIGHNLTKETSAPTATLTNAPSVASNVDTLDVTVGGASVTHYRYALGTDALTCGDIANYQPEVAVATKITNDVTGLGSGTLKLCVIGRNSAGNYQAVASATTTTWSRDAVAPTVSPSTLSTSVSGNSVTVSWTKATDNISAQADLQYAVVYSTSNNIGSVSDAEANGGVVSYTTNIASKKISGLDPVTTYYFNVLVKDQAGNREVYSAVSADTEYPVIIDPIDKNAVARGSERKTFYDSVNQKHWAFYYNGSAIEYAYSTDNITWTSAGTRSYNNARFAVSAKTVSGSTYIVLTTVDHYDVFVERGIVGASGITWDASAYNVMDGSSATNFFAIPTVAIDNNDYVWVVAAKYASDVVLSTIYARRSTNAITGDLSAWGSQQTVSGSTPLATVRDLAIVPRTGAEMFVVANGSQMFGYQYNGSAWSAANTGGSASWFTFPTSVIDGSVQAIAISGTDVYAGGWFSSVAGVPGTANIAKWNGTSWEALGQGVTGGAVVSIAVKNGEVYVGGAFKKAGGLDIPYIAKWNGQRWESVGDGLNNQVSELLFIGTDLYAGGYFTASGSTSVPYVGKWDGSSWSAVGGGTAASVAAMAASGTDLYVTGSFTTVGSGVSAARIAKWDGTSWSALGSGLSAAGMDIAASESDVYVVGTFTTAGGVTVNRVAKWNGSAWSAMGSGTTTAYTRTVCVSGGNVYVGGDFTSLSGVSANRIIKWNGSAWSALGTGTNDVVYAIAGDGTNLYVGGNFTTAGSGANRRKFAKWDGSAWVDIPGLNLNLSG